ncbi:phage antirepressor N-terminal domain-containing protein [Orbus mooreae]|uniref:phage antirepressor N-terminal domain-containing protein n=1 Tax=Orbus mooreae TaxID=3074107 RepID=UPI00370D8EE6
MNNTNINTSNCPVTVPFYGNSLYLVNNNNEPYVPMKPIVDGMGLDWGAQFTKIKNKFNSTIAEITIVASDGKNRMMSCLPLRKLPAWLYSIQPNKVKPELKDTVIKYQEECDEVLWQYWTKGQATKESVKSSFKSYLPEYRQAKAMDLAVKALDRMFANLPHLGEQSKQVIYADTINPIAGKNVIPLPKLENKTFSATEAGEKLGISSNKIGRMANNLHLKTEEYGIFVLDKSRHSDKQVETFRYNQKAIDVIANHLTVAA